MGVDRSIIAEMKKKEERPDYKIAKYEAKLKAIVRLVYEWETQLPFTFWKIITDILYEKNNIR